MALERQNKLYEVGQTREFEPGLGYPFNPSGGLSLRSPPRLGYVLPDGKVSLVNVMLVAESRLRLLDPNTGTEEFRKIPVDANLRSAFGLLSPDLPAVFMIGNDGRFQTTIILNKSLTQVEYCISFPLDRAIKIDATNLLTIAYDHFIACYNIKTQYYHFIFDSFGDHGTGGGLADVKFGKIIQIGPMEYAALTTTYRNIITFKYFRNEYDRLELFRFPNDKKFQVCLPLKYGNGSIESKSGYVVLDICNIGKGLFASLLVTHGNPQDSVGADCVVNIWDSSANRSISASCIGAIRLPEFIRNIRMMPDNKTLIGYGSYSSDKPAHSILLIDTATAQVQRIPQPVEGEVSSLLPAQDGNILIEVSDKIIQMKLTPAPDERVRNDEAYRRFQKYYQTATPEHLRFVGGKAKTLQEMNAVENSVKREDESLAPGL